MGRSLGSTVESTPETDYTKLASQYAPLVTAFVSSGDPRVDAAKLEAQIANLEKMKKTNPTVFKTLKLGNTLNTMRAKLEVVKKQAAEEEESIASVRSWDKLGRAGLGIGVTAGVVGVVLLGVLTYRISKTSKLA
jgi:predicted RecB family endonuclease